MQNYRNSHIKEETFLQETFLKHIKEETAFSDISGSGFQAGSLRNVHFNSGEAGGKFKLRQ